jgi:hypothetical protein
MSEVIFFIFYLAAVGWAIFALFTKRGRDIMRGGRIIKTFDGVSAKRRILSNDVKVHAVDGGSVRLVGLEISTSSVGSNEMTPITFPASEARRLAAILIEAAECQGNG